MECSTTRVEQVAKLLAEEVQERLKEKQDINEMEHMMRELVKEAANFGMQQAIEQGEGSYGCREVPCACGQKAQFVSSRSAVLWTVFGKVAYKRTSKKHGSKMRKKKKLCKPANVVWNLIRGVFMLPWMGPMCHYSRNGVNSRPSAGTK